MAVLRAHDAVNTACDDVLEALSGIDQLSPSQYECLDELHALYSHKEELSPSAWQLFCCDLLRTPYSGFLILPVAHLNALYDDFALHLHLSSSPKAKPVPGHSRPVLRGLGEFIALLAQVAERWYRLSHGHVLSPRKELTRRAAAVTRTRASAPQAAPPTLRERMQHASSCDMLAALVEERRHELYGARLPDGKPHLLYLLDGIARYHGAVGCTTLAPPSIGGHHTRPALLQTLTARQLGRRGATLGHLQKDLDGLRLELVPPKRAAAAAHEGDASGTRPMLQPFPPQRRVWKTSSYSALYAPAEMQIGDPAESTLTATQRQLCQWTPALLHPARPTTEMPIEYMEAAQARG